MKNIVYVILFSTLSIYTLSAQQLPLYSQYMLNGYLINPALAGSEGYTVYSLTAREQWIGYEDGPRTHTFNFQTRMMNKESSVKRKPNGETKYKKGRSGRVGLGGYLYNDRNGLIDKPVGNSRMHTIFEWGRHNYLLGFRDRLINSRWTNQRLPSGMTMIL